MNNNQSIYNSILNNMSTKNFNKSINNILKIATENSNKTHSPLIK